MKAKHIIKGIITFVPGLSALLPKTSTGGTNTPDYCYEVWMKHLTMLHQNGMSSIPGTLAELGPGDSLGIGLSAMLSGVNTYYSLDVVRFSDTEKNLQIFEALVELFKSRAGRHSKGWPDYDQYLNENFFPAHILTEELLTKTLAEERLDAIRALLRDPHAAVSGNAVSMNYMVPWDDDKVIKEQTVDVIISQSVMEHVVDLELTYAALNKWLKPGGMMSHQIDFTSHGLSEKWNGYRAYPEWLWKIIVGKRVYLINRAPFSTHQSLLQKNNFEIACAMQRHRTDGITRDQLSRYWKNKHLSDDDLNCSGTFLQAIKN